MSFADGEITKTIDVGVNGDIFSEGNETFTVNLNNPSGATIDDGQGIGTIVNDDSSDTDLSGSSANTTVILTDTGGRMLDTAHHSQTYTTVIRTFATGAGADSISGNSKGDILDAGAGNDQVRGGAGNDTITGGLGNDKLFGVGGDDTFVFRSGFGHDVIADFSVGDATHHDTLDLRGLGFFDANEVLNHTDNLASAVIHVGVNDITLQNVSKTALAGHLFDFQV